jgi:hypothetical protein
LKPEIPVKFVNARGQEINFGRKGTNITMRVLVVKKNRHLSVNRHDMEKDTTFTSTSTQKHLKSSDYGGVDRFTDSRYTDSLFTDNPFYRQAV